MLFDGYAETLRQNASKGGLAKNKSKQTVANDSNNCQSKANGSKSKQTVAYKEKECKEKECKEKESVSLVSDDEMDEAEAQKTQHEHDEILNAATGAGFDSTPFVQARLIQLYTEYGRDKMINAIAECAIHSASNLAYLKAVLAGGPKREKPKVNAQAYEQRDYHDIQAEVEAEQAERILKRLKEKGNES